MINLLTALNAAMAECSYVQKTGRNDFHRYSYASEADLMESIRPALVKHGLMLIPDIRRVWVDTGRTFVKVKYMLYHVSGEQLGPLGAIGEAQDKGDKATYKAITGAHKYVYYKLFAIATGDDPEGDTETDKAAEAAPVKAAPKPAQAKAAMKVHKIEVPPEQDYGCPPVLTPPPAAPAPKGIIQWSLYDGLTLQLTTTGKGRDLTKDQKAPHVEWIVRHDNGQEGKLFYYNVDKLMTLPTDPLGYVGRIVCDIKPSGSYAIAQNLQFLDLED